MILELDVGNSRIKWRTLQSDTLVQTSAGHVANLTELRQLQGLPSGLAAARLCSVRSGEENAQIQDWLRERFGIDPQQARVTQSCGGVRNQYEDVNRLGIDRWLAMLAAYRRTSSTCIIIDSGTAFTLDLIAADGLHLGGYILPGLGLMRASLESNTAIRLSENYTSISEKLGHSTDEAVFNGTVMALLATLDRLRMSLPSTADAKIFFAGGDAELLHGLAGIEGSEIAPSLVFEGLAVACPIPPRGVEGT